MDKQDVDWYIVFHGSNYALNIVQFTANSMGLW